MHTRTRQKIMLRILVRPPYTPIYIHCRLAHGGIRERGFLGCLLAGCGSCDWLAEWLCRAYCCCRIYDITKRDCVCGEEGRTPASRQPVFSASVFTASQSSVVYSSSSPFSSSHPPSTIVVAPDVCVSRAPWKRGIFVNIVYTSIILCTRDA